MAESVTTSLTLLGRLCQAPADESAWNEFVARYGNVLRGWCRHWSLQATDTEDVVQNILVELFRHIQAYEHRPPSRFRSWLKTIAQRAWYDYSVRVRQKDVGSGDSAILALLDSAEAREGLAQQLDEECTRELLQLAMQRVQGKVEASTWQAFALMTFEGLSGEQTGQRLGMKSGAVFVARSRVRRLIELEYRQLDEQGE